VSSDFRALDVGDLDTLVRLREVAFGSVVDEEQRGERPRGARARPVLGAGGGRRGAIRRVAAGDRPLVRGTTGAVPAHRRRSRAARAPRARRRIGAALSLLYPATVALYRRLGWEHAGLLVRYRLDARSAPAVGTTLRPVASGADAGDSDAGAEADWAAIRACHEATGRALNGPAVRSADGR